ncbi:unnamed protein product [Parajaminaea phylloscopi]
MPAAARTTIAEALDGVAAEFQLDTNDLQSLVGRFHELMDYGLTNDGADMAMIPSFVTGVPDGTEKGTYLALDLGGTNLRVCAVKLLGDGTFKMTQEKYKVSDGLKQGPVANLMDYIATSIDTFLTDNSAQEGLDELSMGFTFSFPVHQTAIDRGTLIKWTKGFNCPDAPGKDVIQLLQTALDRKHIKVRVNALVNDTVGALLAHAYHSHGAFIGAIYGTGTNGAYVADISDVKKLKTADDGQNHSGSRPQKMLINTEWGGFDDDAQSRSDVGLKITPYDNYVDRTSIRPRHHCFEKMISGMYLGEVARVVMIALIDRLVLFSGYSSSVLNSQYGFDTAYVSAIQADKADPESGYTETHKVLVETMKLDKDHVSAEDVKAVRKICHIVALRAARLSAVPIAATIRHAGQDKGDEKIKVGVDGSVVEFLPGFQDNMKAALAEMIGEAGASRVEFGLAKDGSGVGAALCSLQAVKQVQAGHHVVAK